MKKILILGFMLLSWHINNYADVLNINNLIKSKMKIIFKKTLWFTVIMSLCLVVVTLFAAVGCDKSETENNTLQGTNWKLIGIVDAQTGDMKELEPKDCKECYTITFYTNSKATAFSVSKTINVDISNPSEPDKMLFCERYDKDGKDYCDSDIFRQALVRVGSYTVTSTELRLYYHDKDYLSFKIQ